MKLKLLALAVASALAMGASTATLAATSYTLDGNASIVTPTGYPGHAAQLVTVFTAPELYVQEEIAVYSGVSLASTTVTTLSDLNVLEMKYRLVEGDCGGGSPRISIGLPEDKNPNNPLPAANIFVSIGPPTSFTGCEASWQPSGNLLGPDARVYVSQAVPEKDGVYTWEQAYTYLTKKGYSAVSSISLVVDGGGPGGRQAVLVDDIKINGDTVTFEPDNTLVIPLVAQTDSFASQITVRNPFNDPEGLKISVFYTPGGKEKASTDPRQNCGDLTVPPLGTQQFTLATQCGLSGSHFGYVTLTQSTGVPSPFQAFSRTENPQGMGFSVPAYPAAAIEAPEFGHYVVGLKRLAENPGQGKPAYQSNCFVASTDARTPFDIALYADGNPSPIGTKSGTLEAYQMIRYLDIIPGNQANVTARFSNGDSKAALIGFCTVQENTSVSADFRMAEPGKTWKYDLD